MASLAARQPAWARRTDRLALLQEALTGAPDLLAALDRAARLERAPRDLPGPTGESNRLSLRPRGVFLALGGATPMVQALALGNAVLAVGTGAALKDKLASLDVPFTAVPGPLDADALATLPHLADVCAEGNGDALRPLRQALARRPGPIVALETEPGDPRPLVHEQVLCIDTTAAGGNASLLATAEG